MDDWKIEPDKYHSYYEEDDRVLEPAILLKVTLLHGCFSHFLTCAHETQLRNAQCTILQRVFQQVCQSKNLQGVFVL